MNATIYRRYDNQYRTVKLGFSWTTLFFGGFVPLIRGDFLWAIIMFLFGVSGWLTPFGGGTFLIHLIFGIFYNRIYLNKQLKSGWVPASQVDGEMINRYL